MSETYRIRPLEWKAVGTARFYIESETITGCLVIDLMSCRWHAEDGEWSSPLESIDAAKRAAEAWYIDRLKTALEPAGE